MNYKNMGIPQLLKLNQQLTDDRLAIKAQQREISKVIDSKTAEQSLDDDIAALQSKHNVQVVVPDGVETEAGG